MRALHGLLQLRVHVAGLLVFPVRTQDHADRESAALLRKSAKLLQQAFSPAPPPARDAVRQLDRELQSLRAALGPVTRGSYPGHKSGHRERLQQLTELASCVRHLYRLLADAPPRVRGNAEIAAWGARVHDRIDATAALLEGKEAPATASERQQPTGEGDECVRLAAHWLGEADAIAAALQPQARAAG